MYGCCGRGEDVLNVAPFDDAAVLHHEDSIGDVMDHAEVVGDEQQRHPGAVAEVGEQVEHLRLDRHIECRDRLVADEDVRPGRQRPRDRDPLALPAGERGGAAGRGIRRQSHAHQESLDLGGALCAGNSDACERVGDDRTRALARVERAQRVLRDVLDPGPARSALGLGDPAPTFAEEFDAAGVGFGETEHQARRRRLARPRLPHHAEDLGSPQFERHVVERDRVVTAGCAVGLAQGLRAENHRSRGCRDRRFRGDFGACRRRRLRRKPTTTRIRSGDGIQKPPGVLVLGPGQHPVSGPLLDDDSVAHHQNPIGDPGDDGKVVADDQQCGAARFEIREQVQDLRLDGHIERGRRLVRDHELGFAGQSRCDQRSLPKPTREFVRILPRPHLGSGDADARKQLAHPEPALGGRDETVHVEGFGDLGADAPEWVERAEGVLQDERDAPASDAAPLALGQPAQVDRPPAQALCAHGRVPARDPQQCAGGDALSRPGLTDDRDGLTGADVERHSADRVDRVFPRGECDRETAHAQQGRGGSWDLRGSGVMLDRDGEGGERVRHR